MTAGHGRRRGARSWEIKFEVGRDPQTGGRKTAYRSFKGTKREAEAELAKLVVAAAVGTSVDPSRITVAEFVEQWLRDWAAGNVSPKSAERYGELLRRHVAVRIGALRLQQVRPGTLAELYAGLLRDGRDDGAGLAARTVGHVHRVLHRALGHAVAWGLMATNPTAAVDPPKVPEAELSILRADEVRSVLSALRGRSIYSIASLALATGMRRGELLALRWSDVDLQRALLRVERSLETTRAGLRFKPPKTRQGRRTITLPSTAVAELRTIWREMVEARLALGQGKPEPDALVFATFEGEPRHPDTVTRAWINAMKAIGRPGVSLHSLRHSHASSLIAAGLDVLTISRRLGHGSAAITLAVYGHLFSNTDDRAAQAIEAALRGGE